MDSVADGVDSVLVDSIQTDSKQVGVEMRLNNSKTS